jgi:hypothetical protein
MSANNFISIEKKGKLWEVWVRDMDMPETGYIEYKFKTRDEAIDWANDNQTYIEYGICHIDKIEQPTKRVE